MAEDHPFSVPKENKSVWLSLYFSKVIDDFEFVGIYETRELAMEAAAGKSGGKQKGFAIEQPLNGPMAIAMQPEQIVHTLNFIKTRLEAIYKALERQGAL